MGSEEKNTLQTSAGYATDGMEIKLSVRRMNLIAIVFSILCICAGCSVFQYIWGEQRGVLDIVVFNFGYFFAGYFVYILIQALLVLFPLKGNFRAISFTLDWKGWGILCNEPIYLKYYRLMLLAPFVLMGLLPAVHGFCSGDYFCFVFGIFFIIAAGGDCQYLWMLRHFNDGDKIKDGDESFCAIIIKGER